MNVHVISIGEAAMRLVVAAILGSIVGWDRESKERTAGLRTHMLVGLGSALVMIVSAFGFEDILGHSAVVLDPSRMAAQVVTGIGFLGTGAILRKNGVRGLTTAAGLWSVAAVGLAVGGGMYTTAVLATVIILIILAVIKRFEDKKTKGSNMKSFQFDVDFNKVSLLEIESIVESKGVAIGHIDLEHTERKDIHKVRVTFVENSSKSPLLKVIEELNSRESVVNLNIRYGE
jgi:putative Mg2+ transporter-C (MgtC) family protein